VNLGIYSISGQIVRVLVQEFQPAGWHTIQWDSKNNAGVKLPSGVYFCRLQINDYYSETRKIVLLK